MKQLIFLISIIGISLTLSSCNGGGSFMSASAGVSEVLVVMDEHEWNNSEVGKVLYDMLNSPVRGLPQTEPNFKILQVAPENFSNTFKMTRNIVIPEISNIYSQPKLSSEADKYAYGQIILTVKAPDTASFISYVKENTDEIINYLVNKELERTAEWLISDSGTPQNKISAKFGINIYYPKGIQNITEGKDFFWATNDAPEGRRDIVIYQFPYTSESVFEKDSLIAIRDRVLGQHIKGSFNSQMVTSKAYDPYYNKLVVDDIFRAELRGLWEMTTDMMGGPFVSHAFVNTYTNMVVVAEVYVYAPEKEKRNLIRNMEAALYTIKLVDPNQAVK